MPSKNHSDKRLIALMPESRQAIEKRSPKVSGGLAINLTINSMITRYNILLTSTIQRMSGALPEQRDWQFIKSALSSTSFDDVNVGEMPIIYLQEVLEVAQDYENDKDDGHPFSPALIPVLRRWGYLEAVALVDWIEQERLKPAE